MDAILVLPDGTVMVQGGIVKIRRDFLVDQDDEIPGKVLSGLVRIFDQVEG